MNVDIPAKTLQLCGGNERISAIVSFARKDKAIPGLRKELLHRLRDPGSSLIHQSFGRYPARKCRIFCLAHLRRSNDRQAHCCSELTSFFRVLEDFFFEVVWRR